MLVGALGGWDPKNEPVLKACGVGKHYAKLMRKLMVSDTIWWSRDICPPNSRMGGPQPACSPNPREEGPPGARTAGLPL